MHTRFIEPKTGRPCRADLDTRIPTQNNKTSQKRIEQENGNPVGSPSIHTDHQQKGVWRRGPVGFTLDGLSPVGFSVSLVDETVRWHRLCERAIYHVPQDGGRRRGQGGG